MVVTVAVVGGGGREETGGEEDGRLALKSGADGLAVAESSSTGWHVSQA